jgi:hypothetical protein
MLTKQISAVIEFREASGEGPVSLVCFEDKENAVWLRFSASEIEKLAPSAYEAIDRDTALIEGVVWACAIAGSAEAQSAFDFISSVNQVAEDEGDDYLAQLVECVEIACKKVELEITVWHRSSSRYNYAFLPLSNSLRLQVISEMTEGFPEDND